MIKTFITAAALTALTTTAAIAGSHCGQARSAYQYKPMMKPAMSYQYNYSPYQQYNKGYRMQHTGSYMSGYDKSAYGSSKARYSKPDIVDTAISAGSFNTLVQAVQAAGLVETLKGKGPFTVFAPTDAAFAKLPQGTLEDLLADKEKLTKVLTYHVVPGKVMASDLIGAESINTVEGSAIPANALQVSKADIAASNGVIHVIDKVLIPQM